MEALKNVFNEKFVNKFADAIKTYDKSFKKDAYVKTILLKLEALELKERMRLISTQINLSTDLSYVEMFEVLKKSKTHFSYEENMGLASMVFPDFVEVYGLDDLGESLVALECFTIDSSSELAIRPFIIKYEDATMRQMLKWAKSENEHIRRLASEGCRPRLPWAIALPPFKKDPKKVFEVLELLKNDESLYVRKSVANNLNDISKDNEEMLISFVGENINKTKNTDWVLKHASRTLLKKGNKKILAYFGYKEAKHVQIKDFRLNQRVVLGENLLFSFDLFSDEVLGNLRIEFELDFVRLNNKRGKKVFMISQSTHTTNQKTINKKYSFKKITTRQYYKGEHFLSIILNGVKLETKSFLLGQ